MFDMIKADLGALIPLIALTAALAAPAWGCGDIEPPDESRFAGTEVEGEAGGEEFSFDSRDGLVDGDHLREPYAKNQIEIEELEVGFPKTEVGTFENGDVRITWMDKIAREELDKSADDDWYFDSQKCDNASATVDIEVADYGLVLGTFEGKVCREELGGQQTYEMAIEGEFVSSLAE